MILTKRNKFLKIVTVILVIISLTSFVYAQETPTITQTGKGLSISGLGAEETLLLAKIPKESFTRRILGDTVKVQSDGSVKDCVPVIGCTEWSGEVEGPDKGCKLAGSNELIRVANEKLAVRESFEETRHCKVIEGCRKPNLVIETKRSCTKDSAKISIIYQKDDPDYYRDVIAPKLNKLTSHSIGSPNRIGSVNLKINRYNRFTLIISKNIADTSISGSVNAKPFSRELENIALSISKGDAVVAFTQNPNTGAYSARLGWTYKFNGVDRNTN